MNLLQLTDVLLQRILKLLDDKSFQSTSRTCKRLNELAGNYQCWNSSRAKKRVEKMIYKALDEKNRRLANAFRDSCCNAELLNLNLEIINRHTAERVLKEFGETGLRLFALISSVNKCDSREVWPFCQETTKEIWFQLTNASKIYVSYVSMCDKRDSLNDDMRIEMTVKSRGSKDMRLLYLDKPAGLLDRDIVQTRMAGHDGGDALNEIKNTNALRPALALLESDVGAEENEISFEFFTRFLQLLSKSSNAGHGGTEKEENYVMNEIIDRINRNRRKLRVEFLRSERERNDHLNSEICYDSFTYCLSKLAEMDGRHLRNIRLRAQCIRDILDDTMSTRLQRDAKLLPSIISNIDLDSITTGWSCTNPDLFTIWKEFSIELNHGRHLKAVITWREKRDRLNEHSVSNKEICLFLQRKKSTTKINMNDSRTESAGRVGTMMQAKNELKKFASRVRLRKTGLTAINKHFLFIILTTILNE